MATCSDPFGLLTGSFVVLVAAPLGCGGDDNPSRTSANTGGAVSSSTATGGTAGGISSDTGGAQSTFNTGGATSSSIAIGGTAGSTSTASGGTQGTSGGTASTLGGTGAGGANASSPGRNLGQILITNMSADVVSQAYPMFRTNVATCPSETFGDCSFALSSTCDTSAKNYVSAGTVSIKSDASSYDRAVDASIAPNADNTYPSTDLSNLYVGGEVVHVAASGATVPPFSADVTVPLVLLVNSSPPDAMGQIVASTTSDLVIKFSRGAGQEYRRSCVQFDRHAQL